jgi:LacI family transcriptional regulator
MATAAVILNGARSSTVVSTETRQRVLDAAARLGYRANRAAQALRRQSSLTIGLAAGPVQNPFFAEMATLCEGFLLDANYELVMAMDAGRYLDDNALLETLYARGVDGIIMWSERETEGRRLVEKGMGCPVVIFGYPSTVVDCVTADFGLGAQMAVEHLLAKGRRRIGYLCPSESLMLWSGNLRLQRFCDTLTAHGMPPAVFPYESRLGDVSRAREAAESIARTAEPFDGLLCFNDLVAIGAMMGLRRAGLRVPEDVAVVGFDDIPLASQLDTPLTTVDLPLVDICRTAVELLLRRLEPDYSEPSQDVRTTPRLIIRASTEAE